MIDASLLTPWGDDIEIGQRISTGVRNELVRVVVDGQPAVARRGNRDGAPLQWELDVLVHLHETGVSVPRVLPTLDGRGFDGHLVLMEEVPGEPLHPSRSAEIVPVLERVHARTPSWPQRPDFASSHDLLTKPRGGDIRLDEMPEAAVELCRQAWSALPDLEHTVVHGDPNPGNVLDTGTELTLVDWDEARVDHPWLDLAALGADQAGLSDVDAGIAYRAAVAWETATCWGSEPDYARKRLRELRTLD